MIYISNFCGKYLLFCVREVSKHGPGSEFLIMFCRNTSEHRCNSDKYINALFIYNTDFSIWRGEFKECRHLRIFHELLIVIILRLDLAPSGSPVQWPLRALYTGIKFLYCEFDIQLRIVPSRNASPLNA